MKRKLVNGEVVGIKRRNKGVFKITNTVIYETNSENIDMLMTLYNKDPYYARVKFFNDKLNVFAKRFILFEHDNGDFDIAYFIKKYGISTTNKLYTSQRKIHSLLYRSGKFWFIENGKIKAATYYDFEYLLSNFDRPKDDDVIKAKEFIKEYFRKRFYWFSFIHEFEPAKGLSFSLVGSRGFSGVNDLKRHIYGVRVGIANLVHENLFYDSGILERDRIKIWKEIKKQLDNIDCISVELLRSEYFIDTCYMGRTLGYRINCKWGLKRLKVEHDKWSKELTNILIEMVDEVELGNAKIFKDFSEFSGFELITTNKGLLEEGLKQSHCVAGYVDRVNMGSCGIYRINGYTLELVVERGLGFFYKGHLTPEDLIEGRDKILRISQLKGYKNADGDIVTKLIINEKLKEFYLTYNDTQMDDYNDNNDAIKEILNDL